MVGSPVNIDLYNEFAEQAMLNASHSPWRKRREAGEYAMFEVIDCEYENWWYNDFIGVQFLGKIRDQGYGRVEVIPVQMKGQVYMNTGRTISWNDVLMI